MEGDNIQIQEVQVCLHVCSSLYPQCGGCNRNSRGQFFFLNFSFVYSTQKWKRIVVVNRCFYFLQREFV